MSTFTEIDYLTATIASGAALSGAVGLGDKSLVGIQMPSSWTTADLTFQASPDGGVTWDELNVTDFTSADAVAAVQVHSPAASQRIAFDPKYFRGVNNIKVRSGTSASPVNQSGGAVLTLIVRGVG